MQADPEDKKHVVRLERTFEHRGHLCLVFESLRYENSLHTIDPLSYCYVQYEPS